MLLCLLAPVPAEHVDDAVSAHAAVGRVAVATGDSTSQWSGSSTWEIFGRLEAQGAFGHLPVFIHASLSEQPRTHPRHVGQVASWRGVPRAMSSGARGSTSDLRIALARHSGPMEAGAWASGSSRSSPRACPTLTALRVDRKGKPGPPLAGVPRGPTLAHLPAIPA